MKTKTTIARLQYLCNMLNKYSHRWGEDTSRRMLNWVDEYTDIKANQPQVWAEYCKVSGYSLGHDAYDCLA